MVVKLTLDAVTGTDIDELVNGNFDEGELRIDVRDDKPVDDAVEFTEDVGVDLAVDIVVDIEIRRDAGDDFNVGKLTV